MRCRRIVQFLQLKTLMCTPFTAAAVRMQATSLAHSLLLVSTSPVINVGVALLMRHAISAGEVAGTLLALGGGLDEARQRLLTQGACGTVSR